MEQNQLVVGGEFAVVRTAKNGRETYVDALGVTFDGKPAERMELNKHAINAMWKAGHFEPIVRLIGRVLGLNVSPLGKKPTREETATVLRLAPRCTGAGMPFKGNKARAVSIADDLLAQYDAHLTKIEAEKAAKIEANTVDA